MSPHAFLAAVLPPPGFGYYCTAELSSRKKQHVFANNLATIETQAQQWLTDKRDVYFALATFNEEGSREASNAEYLRAVFIDMDGYETKRAAATALSTFLEGTGLNAFGAPWIIGSGGGLHCYWAFEKPVPVGMWKPVAEQFKRLCKERGLVIDMTVTADAARVLRIPGTTNFKKKYTTPRPVQLLESSQPIDFTAFASALETLQPEAPVYAVARASLDLAGTRPSNAPSVSAVKLVENTTTRFKNILTRTSEGDGCGQLQHYIDHATDDGMEPLWRAWLSQTKYCADGERAAVMLTQLHPYDEERMRNKLREIKGPYPCLKFDSENPGVCSKCKHFGKITNPLLLGREVVADNEVKEVELVVESDDDETETIKVVRPTPPKGYMYGANGGVFADRIVEEADGTKRKQQVMLLPYDLFVLDLLHKDGEHIVHLVANRAGKAIDILMPQRYAVSKDECLKTFAQQTVLAAFGSGNDKNLYEYIRACVEDASTAKQAVKIPSQYGWQEDSSFVYSGRVFFPNGGSRTLPMPDLANVTRVTRGHGTIEGWRKMPEMLIRRRLFDHLAMGCIGFGAPLMRFTQMNALTFHAGSTDSGTGKSLALNLCNSIWGHPIRYRTGKGTSPVTMQQRMGNLNSLPFTSDEITHKSRQDMEWFPGFIFDASEGQGKEKSEAHHNRERLNNVSWSTLVLLTSNTHMHDYMSGVRDHTSQGELLRMLEWIPEVKLNWTPDEEDAIKALWENHGVVGEAYVRWLVQNEAVARDVTLRVIARLKKEWNMSGDERYWAAGCGAIVAGAILVGSRYANIVDLPVDEIIKSLRKLVEKARKVVRTGARTSEDVLNAFIRDNYGSFVVLRVDPERRELLAHLGTGQAIDQSIARNRVMGRVEHQVNKVGHVEFFIEEQVIKAHCVAMSFGYDRFKQQISGTLGYVVQFIRKDMMARTKGPQMRVRAMSISRPVTSDDDFEVLPVDAP